MTDIKIKLHSGETVIHFAKPQISDDDIVITDSNLAPLIQARNPIVVPAGESSKNADQYLSLIRQLGDRKAKRTTRVVAFGGGMIGDLAGFAAATYMRGVPLVQVPTTLLAMVDSSVGGKVGVDTPEGKNLLGAFYPADQVFIDTNILASLPQREWNCGMAEVLKYGYIMDAGLASDLQQSPLVRHDDQRTLSIIRRCINLKKQVVESDEFETTGLRAILNFGHTVGHALERETGYTKFTHGEAIAVGMAIETKIGEKLGICPPNLSLQVIADLEAHGLPTQAKETKEVGNIIQSMRGDKKSVRGELSMSLITEIGLCKLVHDIPESVVREVLNEH